MYTTFPAIDFSPADTLQLYVGADKVDCAVVTLSHNGRDPHPVMFMVSAR
jgi:hypothetical protein